MLLLKKEAIDSEIEAFHHTCEIFLSNPGIVCKRICSTETLKWGKLRHFDEQKTLKEAKSGVLNDNSDFWKDFEPENGEIGTLEADSLEEGSIIVAVRKILSKKVTTKGDIWTISFTDYNGQSVLICRYNDVQEQSSLPTLPYQLHFDGEFVSLFVFTNNSLDFPFKEWLEVHFFNKFIKTMKNQKNFKANPLKSLNLVDPSEYYQLYFSLKQKYAEPLMKIWCEVTDPQKYIFEDLGIASYLLLIFRQFSQGAPQKFVDLGCGNGLLVYILANEGHIGTGIDVRARKIWEVYPKCENMTLKVETITPESHFPDADFIIGNHSDELSPWIPVITVRSGFFTKFFLLPCCAYEFNGQKYRRADSKKSVYEDFFEYLLEIALISGFRYDCDRLTIPSTKRRALLGLGRTFEPEDIETFLKKIGDFVTKRMNRSENLDFKTREAVEKVKNCTGIDKEVTSTIAQKVFTELLTKKRFIPDLPNWNAGGSLALSSVISLLNDSERKILKENAGGLQTLLKNHPSVFCINKGHVSIKIPQKLTKLSEDKQKFYKKADCWFVKFHPNGCPLNDADCTYKHF